MVDTRFFKATGKIALGELFNAANLSGIELPVESRHYKIDNAQTLEAAQMHDICFAAHKSYAKALDSTKAGAVIVSKALADRVPKNSVAIICDDSHLAFVQILQYLFPASGYKLAAYASFSKGFEQDIEEDVTLGDNVVIGQNVQLGKGTTIGPNSVIAAGVKIGRNCLIGANVSIECSLIGDNVIIANGATIGAEGFGWLDFGNSNIKIPQLGRVIIQSRVDIGANCSIDRGALGDTMIGENSKIGAMVEIGHGSQIGRNCLLAPMVGLAGGTILMDGVLMGANAGTAGHLTMGEGSIVHPRTSITKDWPAGSKIAGAPAQDIKDLWREYAAIRRLAKGKSK